MLGEPIAFGDGDAVLGLIEAIGARAGVGDLLSGGVRRAAKQVGGGSEAWAMHVKGLEMPGYDPRGLKTLALGLAVNARGACHNRSSAYEADFSAEVDRLRVDDRRGTIAARSEDYAAVLDSMIWCKFLRKAFGDFWGESAQAYEWVTGRAASPEGLRLAGERICTLKKLFNVREGWTRADDTLPPRIPGRTAVLRRRRGGRTAPRRARRYDRFLLRGPRLDSDRHGPRREDRRAGGSATSWHPRPLLFVPGDSAAAGTISVERLSLTCLGARRRVPCVAT